MAVLIASFAAVAWHNYSYSRGYISRCCHSPSKLAALENYAEKSKNGNAAHGIAIYYSLHVQPVQPDVVEHWYKTAALKGSLDAQAIVGDLLVRTSLEPCVNQSRAKAAQLWLTKLIATNPRADTPRMRENLGYLSRAKATNAYDCAKNN